MAQAKIKMMPATHQNDNGFSAPQKTSSTFIQGAPVKLTSGLLVPATTASVGSVTYVSKSSASNVIGIASGKAASGITTNLLVHKIKEGLEFVGNLVHLTAASAKVSKIRSVVYLGKASGDTHYGWSKDTPGTNSASYIRGTITRLIDPASTVNGRVQVQITKGGALSAF